MRTYVIWNLDERAYVARAGSARSFTRDIRKARMFVKEEEALADCCGNERVEHWGGLERFR